MDTLTRRRFLIASGCAGVAAATLAATGFVSWHDWPARPPSRH